MSSSVLSPDAAEIVRRSRSNLAFALACLPKQRRRDMYVFYAFCRVVDDLADDEGLSVVDRRAGLQRWRDVVRGGAEALTRLEESVAAVQRRHGVPSDEIEEIIEGVSMDLEPRRFANWEELRQYCYRVAGCVGLASIRIFGCRSPQSRDYAIHLGYALQITNILRDIRHDWENGRRLYLPQDEMAVAGYTEDDVAHQRVNDGFRALMAQQIARARHHYEVAKASWSAADRIPLLAAETMRCIYSETLDLMEKDGCRVYERRYRLPNWRKAQLVASAWFRGMWARIMG
jgi:phytoene synthase